MHIFYPTFITQQSALRLTSAWVFTFKSFHCYKIYATHHRFAMLNGCLWYLGNLWRELWETAKPVPAVKQAPLFDEDFAAEGILNDLEDIPPSELFEQLFISLLGSGFVIAEEKLTTDINLSKLFCECKDYIIATCQGSTWTEKVDDICQVYETAEMMLLKPEEVLKILKQPEEATAPAGEPRHRFKKLGLIFGNRLRHSSGNKSTSKDQTNSEDNPTRQSFSFIFSKKPPRPDTQSPGEKPICSLENDWTIVWNCLASNVNIVNHHEKTTVQGRTFNFF